MCTTETIAIIPTPFNFFLKMLNESKPLSVDTLLPIK